MVIFSFQKQKPDMSSATVISSSGNNRLTSIQTTGGHARGQKGRRAENNMSEIQQQEMNDIQVRVVKDNSNNDSAHIPNKAETMVEVEAAPQHQQSASQQQNNSANNSVSVTAAVSSSSASALAAENLCSPSVESAQVTKALVNDHHLAATSEPNGASSSMASSSGTEAVEEVPQVKISNL